MAGIFLDGLASPQVSSSGKCTAAIIAIAVGNVLYAKFAY